MHSIIEALLPIFSLIALGYGFRRYRFPSGDFWRTADRLTYYVLLPALIIEKLATTEFEAANIYSLTGLLMLIVIATACFTLLIRKLLPVSAASFTSVFQGSIRPNTYVALAAAVALYGPEGLGLTALGLAGVIPLVNILCILAFAYFVPGKSKGVGGILKSVVSNPLVVACMVGILLNLSTFGLPYVTHDIFKIVSTAALPMGLISVGTGLRKIDNFSDFIPIGITSLIKLILMPILAYFVFTFMGSEELTTSIAVLFASVPCAVSAYILAGHLHGDQKLMATIITIETIVAVVTMPLMLLLVY
ncbi:MAG: AEC family transporter [Cyclobacteriaceae bacterium]